MPTMKEFTIRLEDRPGTLGQLCQALADKSVNILAFQSFPLENGKSSVRLAVDNPAAAKTVLDGRRAEYTETEVAQVRLAHRPGELKHAAATAAAHNPCESRKGRVTEAAETRREFL